jgi:predicted phosphate transport protein (TIGR00153 family)
MWFSKLLPREDEFFALFNRHADRTTEGAHAFMAMIRHYDDPALREKHAAEVDVAERAADKMTAEVLRLLHRTFFTPIDGEQIRSLINALDDVADTLQDTTEVLSLYDVRRIDEDVLRLTEISVRCCERVQHVIRLLARLREIDVAEAARKTCAEIAHLESDADRVMRSAMSRVFRDETDTRQLIKLKAIYEHLETISDRCQDVADVVEGIILEAS